MSPLLIACFNGHTDIVSVLIAANADVHQAVDGGFTPLFLTCEQYHWDVARVLLSAGAMVFAKEGNAEVMANGAK